MKIKLPTDCGNAPRIAIVGDFVTNWAQGATDAVAEWLMVDATWSLVGEGTHGGHDVAEKVRPNDSPEYLEVTSIISHGRLASCDGFFETVSARTYFSHVFQFVSTSKTARVKAVRSYLIEQLAQ